MTAADRARDLMAAAMARKDTQLHGRTREAALDNWWVEKAQAALDALDSADMVVVQRDDVERLTAERDEAERRELHALRQRDEALHRQVQS